MTSRTITSDTVRLADLDASRDHPVRLVLDADQLARGRDQLEILDLAKVRIEGKLGAERRTDWRLRLRIGATVTQACVVTLEPVRTRLDITAERLFTANWTEPDPESETEMPDDVNIDPLPDVLNIAALAFEEISLAMPDYPRSQDAALETSDAAPENAEPIRDEDLKPFAALKALRDRMEE